jgi:hypothetical protein
MHIILDYVLWPKHVNLQTTDTELKQQIIERCLSNRMRRKILMEDTFTLSQILDYGRALARTDHATNKGNYKKGHF